MSAIPPRHTPDAPSYDAPESGGGMVAMYNAASHANAESFPVLKAFQDYLEAERTQARKRVIQLSVFFAVLMCVVVTGFLTAGVFMFRNMMSMQTNMSTMQTKLLDVALANRTAPAPAPAPIAQPSPVLEESAKQVSRATTELQSSLDKKLDGVSAIATKMNDKVAVQDSELQKLHAELRQMQDQSAKLKDEIVAIKKTPKPTAAPAPAALAAATTKSKPIPKPEPKPEARDPRYPLASKEAPVTPAGVTPPPAPQGMMATAIPLKTTNVGTIPWRVLIPE